MESILIEKKLVQVVLEGDVLELYESLKKKLAFKNDSETLRYAIVFTEKRTK